MKKIIAFLYAYFCFKKLPAPYFRTIMAFIGIIIFPFFLLYAIFPIPDYLNPFGMSKMPINNYAFGVIFIGILYLIISSFLNKINLNSYSFSEEQLKRGSRKLLIYLISLFLLIFVLSILHVRNIWKFPLAVYWIFK